MRSLLVLARVSNLPTVWSNCLAAWLLMGATQWSRFALLCLGASLLYIGGMFLNDAVDQDFDRKFRPERPIASGQISARVVWVISALLLLTGWGLTALLGLRAAVVGAALLLTIVAYDVVHKRTVLAPVLMSVCRFFLYAVAAVAASGAVSPPVIVAALALASYITGLSYLARVESRQPASLRWPLPLLFAPAALSLWARPLSITWPALLVQILWTVWCVQPRKIGPLPWIPRGVAGLLAGIVLVDWLASSGFGYFALFPLLFCFALVLQRIAPAT